MELSSGGIKMKILFVIGTAAVLSGRSHAQASQEQPGTCNPGWELCPTTKNHCVPKMCRNVNSKNVRNQRCPVGQVYCETHTNAACITPCPPVSRLDNPSVPQQPQPCGPGLFFCSRTRSCESKADCGEAAMSSEMSCSQGFTFCAKWGGCILGSCPEQGGTSSVKKCRSGTVLCASSGYCQASCGLFTEQEFSEGPGEGRRCYPWEVWCAAAHRCVVSGVCGEDGGDGQRQTQSSTTCPPSQVPCLETGRCAPEGKCEKSRPPSLGSTCPPDEEFCLSRDSCVPRGRCAGPVLRPPAKMMSCAPGQLLCVATGTCKRASECGSVGSPGRGKPMSSEICPPNKVFCLSSGTCKTAGRCEGRSPDSMNTMCPRGYIYCLQKWECVSADKGCNTPTSNRVDVKCPPGTVFSLLTGSCKVEPNCGMPQGMPDLQCSGKSFAHTTCLSNQHCPLGFTCCPDPDTLHLQCVDADGRSDEKSINMTCHLINKPQYDTGLTCSDPKDCPVTSLCCGGKCMSNRGSSSCPPLSLYCPLTSKCQWLGMNCGMVCPPNTVYCTTSGQCVSKSDCEFDFEVPWTLPGPLRLPSNCNNSQMNEITMSDIYSTATTVTHDSSGVVFKVENLTTWYGTWVQRAPASKIWTPLEPSAVLMPSDYLGYMPHPGIYVFGLDHINMTERASGIRRKVVQLVAPEFPVIPIKEVVNNISLKENEPKKLKLLDIVNVTCDDDAYWKAWEMSIDLPKQASQAGLLDSAHPAIVSWVGSLQQLHLNVEEMHSTEDDSPWWSGGGGNYWESGGEQSENTRRNSRQRQGHREERNDRGRLSERRRELSGATSNVHKERGLWLEWTEPPTTRSDVKIDIFFSLDGGDTWILMNHALGIKLPLSSCESAQDILVKLHPSPNAVGSPKLLISVFPSQSSQACPTYPDEHIITLEIQEVNDAPQARTIPVQSQVPSLTYGTSTVGTPASVYANAFYVDSDEDSTMCIIIIQAYGSNLGVWQVSEDDGATYKNIGGLEDDPIPSTLGVTGSHRGIVNLEEMRDKNMCDITNMDLAQLSSLPSNNECLGKLMMRMENSGGTPSSTRTAGENEATSATETRGGAAEMETGSLRGQRQFTDFETGNTQVFTVYPMMRGFYVPATALIRFNHTREYWTLAEARQGTRLVFLASDNYNKQEASPEAKMINVSFAQSWKMGDVGNVARDPVVMSAEWRDCSGQLVMSDSPRVLDVCSVCGGDDSSCFDCNGDFNGNARMHCSKCVGGNTGKTESVDCSGKCGNESIMVERGASSVCVPKDHPNVTFCDGSTDSNAFLNPCGTCVGGLTGLPDNANIDKCGVCGGKNECVGCDGEINSGAVNDICGACLQPNNPDFNNCKRLGLVSNSVDAAVNDLGSAGFDKEELRKFFTLKASVAGVKSKKYNLENCTLVNKDGQKISAKTVKFKSGTVQASFKIFLSGKVILRCSFKAKKKRTTPKEVDLETPDEFEIMDSRAVMLETDRAEVNASIDTVVTIKVRNSPSLDSAACFLMYQDQSPATGASANLSNRRGRGSGPTSDLAQELATYVIEPDKVECLVPKNARPGQAQIGLVLTAAALQLILRALLNVPTKSLMVKASAPKVTSAILDSSGQNLVISFDQNIESETECSLLIEWPWIEESKKPKPNCKFQASKLQVKLKSGIMVKANTSLTFADSNGIRAAHGDATTAPEATGSFKVIQPDSTSELTFQLRGDTQACNTSIVKLTVTRIRGARIEEVTPKWNITWEPGSGKWSQAETLQMWGSIHALQDKMTMSSNSKSFSMSVPGSGLLPGKEYLVEVHLEAEDGRSSASQGRIITAMPPDQLLKIRINGPTQIRATSREMFKAKATLCSETESVDDNKLEYYWNVDGEGVFPVEQKGKTFTLRGGLLRGGSSYTLTVTALSPDPFIMGISRVELITISQGLELITSSDSIKVGSVSSIKIHASECKDLDNLPGSLSFRWWCKKESGEGCFASSGKTLTRLENTLSKEELSSPIFKIPGAMLPPDRYIISVEISKNNISAQKDVNVEVTAGQCALITTKPSFSIANPQKRILVPTFITGPADLEVQWISVEESGYLKADISQIPTGKMVKLWGESKEREHDLVLPIPSEEEESTFTGLEGDASYKFRILVKTPQGQSCYSDLLLLTNSPPEAGSFEVSPTSGEALATNFTFKASGWTDSDNRLTTYFGYQLEGDDSEEFPVVWTFVTTEEDPTADLILPADSDNSKVIPMIKVCDSYDACTIRKGYLLTLSFPSELPPDLLKTLIADFRSQMQDDAMTKAALDTITTYMITLASMGKENEQNFLLYQVEDSVKEKINSLFNRMKADSASIERSSDMLEGLWNMEDQFTVGKNVQRKMKTLGELVSAAILGEPIEKVQAELPETPEEDAGDPIHFPSDNQQLDSVRNLQNSPLMKGRRRARRVKRNAAPANGTQQYNPLTEKDVILLLKAAEQPIMVATDGKDTSDDLRKLLFQDLPKYYAGLCLGISLQDPPSQVLGNLVALAMRKSNFIDDVEKKVVIANSKGDNKDFVKQNSFVIWGDILIQYKTWSCGKKGDEGEVVPCYGACMATTLLKNDVLAPLTGAKSPGELRTPVAETLLISPVTGVEITINMGSDRIIYELHVENDTKPEGYRFKCYGWDNNEWNKTYCNTGKLFIRGGVNRLRCLCNSPVYVAGFLIKIPSSSSSSETSTLDPSEETFAETTEMPWFLQEGMKHARIIIKEDYKTVVGDDPEKFILYVKPQISELLEIPAYRLVNMKVSEGSILVDFDIVSDPTRSSSLTSDVVVENLYSLINSGKLKIVGPTNEELTIPPQNINGLVVEEKNDPTKLPIIIGAVVGGIVLIVLVFICVAICLKNKKRMDKVQPLQMTNSKQPTYSSIHFEQSLDGTMAKYRGAANTSNRSLSSGGTYSDEGIFIERRSTANSSRVGSGGSSTGGVSFDSGTGQEVPEAFKYRSPTKEELERSGPIPEHIDHDMRGIRLGHALPGKPDYLLRELPKWPDWSKNVNKY
ncbi:uncharacterized protein LOC121876169 isoform X3 [Homarus americanus]|uniref:uncharacterized protein LOC121876169 isoform X3 n=1 Tax=Homarus americanus TaxID=6706 RepID=UPI001C47BDB4|nr:uncharacterized protein LOC121876169 isoform X3 [Homarus americanus]